MFMLRSATARMHAFDSMHLMHVFGECHDFLHLQAYRHRHEQFLTP